MIYQPKSYTSNFASNVYSPLPQKKPRAALLKAKETLDRCYEYNSKYYTLSAETYCDLLLDLHDQPGALKIAKENVEKYPDPSTWQGLEARKLLDRIQGSPKTHEPTYAERNPHHIVFMLQIGILALAIFFLVLAINFSWGFLWMTGFCIVGFMIYNKYLNSRYASETFANAIDEVNRRVEGRR